VIVSAGGAVALGTGVLFAIVQSRNHSTCNSFLGQVAQGSQEFANRCKVDDLLYFGGIALAVIGFLALIAAIVLFATVPGANSVTPRGVPVGWYPVRPGIVRHWNGRSWGPETHQGPPL
jgi:hypothetical protein